MHRDRDFEAGAPLPPNESALIQDLDLDILHQAMAHDDRFLYDIAKKATLLGMHEIEGIRYRQQILQDCLANEAAIREIYSLSVEAIENKQRNWFGIYTHLHPGSILYSAVRMIELYVPLLERLRKVAAESEGRFRSEGFDRFFSMIKRELDDEYFETLRAHLKYLALGEGVLVSARLGPGCESVSHALRKPKDFGKSWLRKIFGSRAQSYSFSIDPRDESGGRALEELRDRGINFAADSLGRSADHIESFMKLLRVELAFYVGCLNLHAELTRLAEPLCFPTATASGALANDFTGLYNICLSLHGGRRTIGNDALAKGRNPVIITGVNEGGKSTFLRSIGVAQLMMQCGMFVPAVSFSADIVSGVFTHFRRKEDRNMESGKFDEELARMDAIANLVAPHSLILFNESFAATNEREGAEIAGQITKALIDHGIRVIFVTHLYTFAEAFAESSAYRPLFLRAERQPDGVRTYRLVEGPPSERSHGEDLYRKVFGDEGQDGWKANPA